LLAWTLVQARDGKSCASINFKILMDMEIPFRFDSETMQLHLVPVGIVADLAATVQPIVEFNGYELNGLVWGDLSMFDKFLCRRPGRSFVNTSPGKWFLDEPIRANGGIDFREDGVCQFLMLAEGQWDYAFSALNDCTGRLVCGTGFGSSHCY